MIFLLLAAVNGIKMNYIPPTKIPPSQRYTAVMDYLQLQDSLIIFSGALADASPLNDIWEFSFSDSSWIELIPTSVTSPGIPYTAPRSNSGCFASKFGLNFYIFGGNSEIGPLNDLWVYQIANYRWVNLFDINTPTPRSNYAYTSYDDGVNEYFVVFGGSLVDGEDNNLYM